MFWRFLSPWRVYGDMSVPAVEVYSIEEAFADLSGIPGDLITFGRTIRAAVYKKTGIPVGVGIAPTKTLAKLANHTAKHLQAHTGGMVDICDQVKRDWVCETRMAATYGV